MGDQNCKVVKMIEWIWTACSITGAILNAKMFRIGFIIWIVANTGWVFTNLVWGLYAQIPIWVVFNIICIYGWFAWRDKEGVRSLKQWMKEIRWKITLRRQ